MSITKVQILQQVSEEQIIKFYIPDFDPQKTGNYKSPFVENDEKPSLNIYKKGAKLMFKSHNTGHQGDVFQFVADLKGIDCKAQFQQVLETIQHEVLNANAEQMYIQSQSQTANKVQSSKKENIKISFDKEQKDLYAYFAQCGILPEILNRFNVKQIKYHEFVNSAGKTCKFDYKKLNQLAVCYTIEDKVKVYFPEIEGKQKKAFGFKNQTTAQVFGLSVIKKMIDENGALPLPELFISAGEKDCLSLNTHGFTSICFQSENTNPTQEQIQEISALGKQVFIIYDTDEAGIKAANKLAQKTGWKGISIPKEYKDVTEYFTQKSTAISELKSLVSPNTQVQKTIFHITEEYLNQRYEIRFNTIKLELEYRTKGAEIYQPLNENDLYVELNKANIRISTDKLVAILRSNFVVKYNPFLDYFENLPAWNGADNIQALASHLVCDNHEQMSLQFKKWLVRTLKCAIEPKYFNKQAFVLIHSKQNSGKTSFCRFLCPPTLSDYMIENISDDKDSRIALAKNFLINLDELASLARHEINSLKTLFSKDSINERLPYDRKNSIIPRVSSFIGSTNMAEFLTDETGSVRWLCFEIKEINWAYRQNCDINQVWSQAYYLYKNGFLADMDAQDIAENEIRNAKFQQRSTEAELIPQYLQPTGSHDPYGSFLTASEVLIYLTIWTPLKLNKIMIGRAMLSCGFQRVKDSKSDRYGYWCIKLKN